MVKLSSLVGVNPRSIGLLILIGVFLTYLEPLLPQYNGLILGGIIVLAASLGRIVIGNGLSWGWLCAISGAALGQIIWLANDYSEVGFRAWAVLYWAGLLLAASGVAIIMLSEVFAQQNQALVSRAIMLFAALLTLVVGFNYLLHVFPQHLNLTQQNQPQPSQGTLDLIKIIQAPVTMRLVYPTHNRFFEPLKNYLQQLEASQKVSLSYLDGAPHTTDGTIVPGSLGIKTPQGWLNINIGLNEYQARQGLVNLDFSVFHALLRLIEPPRNACSIIGSEYAQDFEHSEFSLLMASLNYQNSELHNLDACDLVLMINPYSYQLADFDFQQYMAKGGKILLYNDLPLSSALEAILGDYVSYHPEWIAQEHRHGRASFRKTDHAYLLVDGIEDANAQAELHFLRAGSWQLKSNAAVVPLIYSEPSSWRDINRDYAYNHATEHQQRYLLAFSLKAGLGELLAFSDVDVISDYLLDNAANKQLAFYSLTHLLNPQLKNIFRPQPNFGDTIIENSQSWLLWFALPVVVVPLSLLLLGLLILRWRKLYLFYCRLVRT